MLGALEVIKKKREPTPAEVVAAFEATGDYSETLPYYHNAADDSSKLLDQVNLVKCLLRLNQPHVVLSYVESIFKRSVDTIWTHN